MSGVSKRVSGSWVSGDYGIMKTATDTITTLPADIYTDGNSATVGISGNMEQNGTPTPQNPIQPSECGDRTGNLFDKNTITPDKFVTTGGEISSTNYYCSDYIPVSEGAYYLANVVGSSVQQGYVVYDSNKQAIRQGTISGGKSASGVANISANEYYIRINMHIETSPDVVMVNSGSTPLPYEPYGVKIPISSASTTTPVYLGETQSTRQIKKYICTGDETVDKIDNNIYYLSGALINDTPILGASAICTHYENNPVTSGISANLLNGQFTINQVGSGNYSIIIHDDINGGNVSAQYKQYLATQYANGTPVTVWYVLANSTTGIVNEPIRKIGDYADTVSGITIPTTTGANSFDVLTTLKPSEVTANYHGWHTGAVHERENGAWT